MTIRNYTQFIRFNGKNDNRLVVNVNFVTPPEWLVPAVMLPRM
jgi:hypothetical protein